MTEENVHSVISFGYEANNFLKSKLAECILDSAQRKVISAQDKLCVVAPTDTNAIVALQKEVLVYNHFLSTLEEIVAAGDSAYQIYLNNIEERGE